MSLIDFTDKSTNLALLGDPACDIELWWALANYYPWEALQSPLWDLISLEAPDRCLALLNENPMASTWIGEYCNHKYLTSQYFLAFTVDCLERILLTRQVLHGHLVKPFEEIVVRAKALLGQSMDYREMCKRWAVELAPLCQQLHDMTKPPENHRYITSLAAGLNVFPYQAHGQAHIPSAVAEHMNIFYHHSEAYDDLEAEEEWQWQRLLGYLIKSKKEKEAP